jgi:hypothetical protein
LFQRGGKKKSKQVPKETDNVDLAAPNLRHGDKIKHEVHWSKAPIAVAVKSRSHVCPGLDPFGSTQCGRTVGLTKYKFVSNLLHRFVSSLFFSYSRVAIIKWPTFLAMQLIATIARTTEHEESSPTQTSDCYGQSDIALFVSSSISSRTAALSKEIKKLW